jgi:hypothetical protein
VNFQPSQSSETLVGYEQEVMNLTQLKKMIIAEVIGEPIKEH